MKRKLAALLHQAAKNIPFHRRRAPRKITDLAAWPLMDKYDLLKHSPEQSTESLDPTRTDNYTIFASGGTTIMPKFLFYTEVEMATIHRNLAKHFIAAEIKPQDRVMNYFLPGNLYSSFVTVHQTLMLLPIVNVPVGAMSQKDEVIAAIERFHVNVIVGMPTSLLDLARHTLARKKHLEIDKVFYGGEMMYPAGAELLRKAWDCRSIRSAGYATVDAGAVGWQCLHCNQNEHFPFKNVFVEIIDDEIVVTPLYRRLMPIIRYRTGDRGKWVEPSCDCGGGLPLFKLQGRIDSVILIWGCRIIHDHIILPLIDRGLDTATLQIEARLDSDKEILTVRFEKDSITSMADALKTDLRNDVYTLSTDVANTLSRPFLDTHLFFEPVQPGTLKRNERTGKVVPFLDLRASA